MDAELKKQLSENKLEILETLRNKAGRQIIRHPLSYAQQALWFLWRAVPQASAYNVTFTAKINSVFESKDLKAVFQALLDRHPMLRTVYQQIDGEPVQCIHGYMPVDFIVVDASEMDDDVLHAAVVADSQEPFDLEKGPLMRIRLFRKNPSTHVLLVAAHHIAMDGWSMWIMLDEMRRLYSAQKEGRPAKLQLPPTGYTSFVEWQKTMLEGDTGKSHWAFWKKQLAGDLPLLHLPGAGKHSKILRFDGHSHVFNLDPETARQIKSYANEKGVTLYTLLLAVYLILLFRYTWQEDILVSTPMSGRSRPEFSGIIGCFVNPMAIRVRITPEQTFEEYLSSVKNTVLEAMAHQDYPLALLTKKLRPDRNLIRSPLFQVDFVLQKPQRSDEITAILNAYEDAKSIDFGGLELESYYIPQQEGQLDLSLELVESAGTFSGSFKYSRDILDADTVTGMRAHFECLLQSALREPDCPISTLQMIPESERVRLLSQPKDFSPSTSDDFISIPYRIEMWAQQQPESIAVYCDGQVLTYESLNNRANQLAHHLIDEGVLPETIVGIYLDRSPELITAVLAVLKTGAAYLPLDPSYPQSRIDYMLEDTGAAFVISSSDRRRQLKVESSRIITIDDPASSISKRPLYNPGIEPAPSSLAYVIYTSGTTGRAKGVMVEHHSLANAYSAWEEAYELSQADTHLQMASFSFDVFTGDFARGLCSGAKLVLCPRDILMSADKLFELIQVEGVNCAEFVPVVLRGLLSFLRKEGKRLDQMRLLICGSDSWFMDEYNDCRMYLGQNTRLINSFGVTEATIDSSYFENNQDDYPANHLAPIGKPFRNMQLLVLDAHLQPVPVGVVGELYIGGEGVARGYWNNIELTSERFLASPFHPENGNKIYKSGDLARRLTDGNLELLGRIDHQLKIRGYRVEPGEIETVIKRYRGVGEAAVIAWNDSQNSNELAAFIATINGESIELDQLRKFLKKRLPEYMIPSSFNLLETMPLTPAGKIDRQSFPKPEKKRLADSRSYIAPQTETQIKLAAIWQEVLKISEVGLHDDFFELGGHSLLATQVHSRLQQTFATRFDLRNLFEASTLLELSDVIDTMQWITQTKDDPETVNIEERDELEL